MARGVRRRPDLPRPSPGAPEQAVRPQGQPPAHDRRHRGLPDRPRLRAGHHRARRQGRRRLQRADDLPARGPDVPSFGVVKAPDAQPTQIGLEGEFYPTYAFIDADGEPVLRLRRRPRTRRSRCSPTPATSGMDNGSRSRSTRSTRRRPTHAEEGRRQAVPRRPAAGPDRRSCPTALGTVTLRRASSAGTRSRSARRPGKRIALAGVVLALVGLLGSLFIRPRRVWVRARREGGRTLVEVAGPGPLGRRGRRRRARRRSWPPCRARRPSDADERRQS